MKTGKLIVFEGISGTGKETQAKLLHEYLKKKEIISHVVYHPTPELKKVLSVWRKNRHIDHITELYLLLADRYDRVQQVIRPAMIKGEWVISLRNWVSALVYQGKIESERVWITKEFLRFEPKSDYLFHFDVSPGAALRRVLRRHESTGEALGTFETREKLTEKRTAYKHVLQAIPHITIDATQSIETIHRHITSSLIM